MDKIETIEDLYKRKFDWMPDDIRNEIGHFNMFKLDSFVGSSAKPIPYERMFEEINSDYLYKYDVLRNLAFEVLHFAMKLRQPMEIEKYQ